MNSIRHMTINQLERYTLPEPRLDSYVASTCHRLRNKPVAEFTTEDLRFMIGQEVGLEWLLPIALEQLEHDPFVEGDLYPGDLLVSVLRIRGGYWQGRAALRSRVESMLRTLQNAPDEVTPAIEQFRRQADAEPGD